MLTTTRTATRRLLAIGAVWTALAACASDDPATTEAATTTTTQPATTEPATTAAPPLPVSPAGTVAELLALGRPVILAHAAGEDTAPHSTLYGFAEAVRAGVDVLDVDLQLTSDGVLVIQHDDDTGRTTERDLMVAQTPFAELTALDNAHWFTASCTCADQPESAYELRGIRTGERPPPAGYTPDDFAIPAFRTLIERYPGWVLNIEIKGEAPAAFATADALAALLTETASLDRSVVTSFDDAVVEYFHGIAPTVVMTPGLDASTEFVLGGVSPPAWAPILQVPPEYQGIEVFTPEYVDAAKALGLITWVWPNGSGEDVAGYTALLELGADGVNASDPAAGVEALQAFLAG